MTRDDDDVVAFVLLIVQMFVLNYVFLGLGLLVNEAIILCFSHNISHIKYVKACNNKLLFTIVLFFDIDIDTSFGTVWNRYLFATS